MFLVSALTYEGREIGAVYHMILYSGGIQSAYMAYLVKQKERKEDILLVYCDTKAEDPDNARFRREVAEFLDLKVMNLEDGRSLYELVEEKKFWPNFAIKYCNEKLKIHVTRRFFRQFPKKEVIKYYGMDESEGWRINNYRRKSNYEKFETRFPLYDCGKSKEDMQKEIEEGWKIKTPRLYAWMNHSNCLPCFLAGQKHYRLIYFLYPQIYERLKGIEKKIGKQIFRRSLSDLEKGFEKDLEYSMRRDEIFEYRKQTAELFLKEGTKNGKEVFCSRAVEHATGCSGQCHSCGQVSND